MYTNEQAKLQADLGISCLKQAIVTVLASAASAGEIYLSATEILDRLNIEQKDVGRIILSILELLIDEGEIEKVTGGGYRLRSDIE